MRTTVELDTELIATLKVIAARQEKTLGQVISELTRQSLSSDTPVKVRNGVRLFPLNNRLPKPDLHTVNKLRD